MNLLGFTPSNLLQQDGVPFSSSQQFLLNWNQSAAENDQSENQNDFNDNDGLELSIR